ncbi:beta strand repeat-containing protein [Marinicella meishanensis]|uniref:beta strand repeat-containing protein n=1 Tax=Marinicella meishanensis TaxID=2873263 RepID=UPI001CBCE44E|nr:IPTL-CTERM sorting domain-containing protein [Marinicella sp. NBU2979]
MKKLWVLGLLLLAGTAAAIKGKDGDFTVVASQQVNYFTGLTAVNTVGGVTLTVSNINDLTDVAGIYATPTLTPGDLIMLYQAQGASFADSGNNSTYGAFNLGNAGRYELYEVISVTGNDVVVAENGNLCTGNSLIYSYNLGQTQVIRVPQFDNLTVNAGGSITTTAWNGSRGGVVAIDVNTNLTVNGTITAAAAGFRGGVVDNVTTGAGTDVTLYRGASNANGAEKGESVLGFAAVYDANNGRYGRGAPANGGGGGNAHNGGGGGGANGNNGVAWTGQGNPDNGPAGWSTAWDIDGTITSASTSSGGGRGGYTYGSSNQDALTLPPGSGAWGGNLRRERGGLGGRPVPFDDVGRLFFGGGGGAGDGNNGRAGAGGRGGGLVYLITTNLSGTGTINVNGQDGFDTANNGGNNDAPGGGGAGGTIVVSASSTAAGVNLTANGGVGGDQLPIGNENEGPGGGGGGGVISVSGGTGTPVANGGANGISQSTAVTEFMANGATIGAAGQPNEVTSPVVDLPVCRAINSLSTTKALTNNADEDGSGTVTEGDTLTFTITVTNTGDFPLNNMTASDPQLTPNSNNCGTVAPAGTCVLIGTYEVTLADVMAGNFTNTGSGTSDETGPVDDVVMTPVFGSPALTTNKQLTNNADEDGSGTVTEGDTLTFTITVTNTGNIPLNNMTASDPQLIPNSINCGTVAPAGTCVLVGTYVVTLADVMAGNFTNTGSGNSDETGPVDDVVVTPVVGSPALTTDKQLTNNADEDGSGTVTEGDTLTFTITVTNTGNIPLNNLTASDPQLTPNSNNCGTVAPAGTCVLVGTYVVTNADVLAGNFTNTGSGNSDETGPVDDVVVTPVLPSPALTVAKALTNNADEDGSGTITENDTLTFTITTTNTGNIPLNNVSTSDPMITPNTINCGTVPVGGTCVLVGTYAVTAADITNGSISNTGTGDSDETPPVTDTLITPTVGSPDLTVVKALTNNADEDGSGTVTEGDTLTFTVTSTNSGNIPLNNMTTSDPMISPNTINCGTVPPAGTCVLVGTYVVTAADVTNGSITNTGTGDSDETPPANDVLVTPVVGSPALIVSKALTGNADEDGSSTITENDTLTFTITTTNTGNIPLNNVSTSDPMITPNTINCGTVAVGGTCVLVGTYVVTAADILNGSINNTGTGNSNETGPETDTLVTPVVGNPGLDVVKTLTNNADEDGSGTISLNDTLTYTVVATNTGNITLNNVTVTDTLITPNNTTCVTLAPAATCSLTGTYVVQQADVNAGQISNTGTADSDETPPVQDTINTPLSTNPALSIDKSLTSNADEDGSGTVTINDTLTFTIVATNVGNVTLNNVVVTDNMITPNNTSCAVLLVGGTCTLVGTFVVQQSDVDNGQVVNVAQAVSDETITDPEIDTETVDTEGPISSAIRVPTLSQWMLLLMALLMLAVAAYRQQLRR